MGKLIRHKVVEEKDSGELELSDNVKAFIFDVEGNVIGYITTGERNSAIQFFEESDFDYLPTIFYDKKEDKFVRGLELREGGKNHSGSEIQQRMLSIFLDSYGYAKRIVQECPRTFKQILEVGKELEKRKVPTKEFVDEVLSEDEDEEGK